MFSLNLLVLINCFRSAFSRLLLLVLAGQLCGLPPDIIAYLDHGQGRLSDSVILSLDILVQFDLLFFMLLHLVGVLITCITLLRLYLLFRLGRLATQGSYPEGDHIVLLRYILI